MSNKDFDADYSAGEHLPEQTPVFNERMKRFAKLMQDAGIRLEMIDIATNPVHANQAGFDAACEAMQEIIELETALAGLVDDIQRKPNNTRYAIAIKIATDALKRKNYNR